MIEVIKAEPRHMAESQSWLSRHGTHQLPNEFFPPTTYAVPGMAALSLYLTDSNLAFVESLIGNPDLPKAQRSAALDAVIQRVVDEAEAAGTLLLVGFPQRPEVEARFCRHGFHVAGRGLSMIARTFGRKEGA